MIAALLLAYSVPSAYASPDRLVVSLPLGVEVADLAASENGNWVGALDGNGTVYVLDTRTWIATPNSPCGSVAGLAVVDDAKASTFFVGCDDGSIWSIVANDDGTVSTATELGSVGTGAVLAVESDGTNVYAVVESDGTQPVVSALSIAGGKSVTGWPVEPGRSGLTDTGLFGNLFFAIWGTDDVTKVTVSAPSPVNSTENFGSRKFVDMWAVSESRVFLADSSGSLFTYAPSSLDLALDPSVDFGTVTAVGGGEDYMLLAADDDLVVYEFSGITRGSQGVIIPGAGDVDEIVTVEGYAFAGTSDGDVQVYTDRPWVVVTSVTPTTAVAGDEITIAFSTDTAGTYTVKNDAGETLADGTAKVGESTATVSADGLEEGANRLWVYVSGGGTTGRGAGIVTVDNPPPAAEFTLGTGDERLSISIPASDVADLKKYVVYVTTTPFSADDYPSGGPDFDGDTSLKAPKNVNATPGEATTTKLKPLANGTTYYVAIRAFDAGGKEGPMSDVQSASPEETYSAAELAGEPKYFCGLPLMAAGWMGTLAAAFAVSRRRRMAMAVGLLLPGVALAKPKEDDLTDRHWDVAVRYGPFMHNDDYLGSAFGETGNQMFRIEGGWCSNFVEVNLDAGLYRDDGFLLTKSGATSTDADTFSVIPLGADVVGRIDIWNDQPFVPFARIGGDYWLWQEAWDVGGADDKETREGAKYGWHYGFGAMLLLDWLDKGTASQLEADTGINDTYLVGEYRSSQIAHGTGLDFTSTEFTLGLQFDF